MSQENVEIVVGVINAWLSGDRETARAAFDPHAAWIMPVIDSRVMHGLAAIEAGIEGWRRNWEDFSLGIGEAIDAGEHVVVATRQRGVGKTTGAAVELVSYGAVTLRNSKIVRAEFFDTKAEALEAVGLRE
jgi:ketosteroid isomerase-like protein